MRQKTTPTKFYTTLLLLLFGSWLGGVSANATDYVTANAAANWGTPAHWSPVGTPGPTDNVTVLTGHALTANTVARACNNLTIQTGGSFNMSNQNVTVNGTTSVAGSITDNNDAGTNIFIGKVTIDAGGVFSTGNNSNYTFSGGIEHNGTTFSLAGGGTITFNLDQILSGISTITSSRNVVIPVGITVTNQGTVTFSGVLNNTNVASTWINDANATLNYGNATVPMNTNGTLTATANGNTVNYNRNDVQTVRAVDYFNLTTSATSGTRVKTVSNQNTTVNVAGALTVGGFSTLALGTTINTFNVTGTATVTGILDFSNTSTKTVTISDNLSGVGTIDMDGLAAHTLNLGGATNAITTFTTAAGNTVDYNRAGDQTVFASANYRNLIISGSGVKTLQGNSTINNNLTVSAGTFDLGTVATTVGVTGTTAIAGTLTFGGTSTKTVTMTGNLSGAGMIDMSGGSLLHTLNLTGATNDIGTLTTAAVGSTINYNRNGVQTVFASPNYRNLTLSVGNTKTLQGNAAVGGNLLISAGTFNLGTVATTVSVAGTATVTGTLDLGTSVTTFDVTGATAVAGTLTFNNTSTKTVSLTGNLSGAGTINMSGGALPHVLNLAGATNAITTFTAGSGTVDYNGVGAQGVFRATYHNITFSNGGDKSFPSTNALGATINGVMNFNSGVLVPGTDSLIFTATASVTGTLNGTNMIRQTGLTTAGRVIKQYTAAGNFTFPVGTGSDYTPITFNLSAATVAGTGRIGVRNINTASPNQADNSVSLQRYWQVSSSNLSAITGTINATYVATDANVTYEPTYVPAQRTTVWVLGSTSDIAANIISYTRTAVAALSGDWTAGPEVAFSAGTFFSRQTGDWEDVNTWSITGYAGSVAPFVPTTGSIVQIGNSRTVTVTANTKNVSLLTIEASGILDVAATTGHTFTTLNGTGKLMLSSGTFPTVTNNNFVTTAGSTVEYYGAGAINIAAPIAYRNLTISGTGTKTLNVATVTVNEKFYVGTGSTFNPNTRNLIVSATGNAEIDGSFIDNSNTGTNTFNGRLHVNVGGSLTTANTSAFVFGNGIVNNGTINQTGAGAISFTTQKQFIEGAGTTALAGAVTLANGIEVVNKKTVSLIGVLNGSNGASRWTDSTDAVLNYANANAPMLTGLFDAVTYVNTVDYNGTVQNVRSSSYYRLNISNSGVKTLLGAISVAENLAITGTATNLTTSSFQITGNATGTLTMAAGTFLFLGNTGSNNNVLFPTNYLAANITLDASSTVRYQGNSVQFVSDVPTYGNLQIARQNSKIVTGANTTLNVAGNITISDGKLDLGATLTTLNVTGNISITDTLQYGSTLLQTVNVTGDVIDAGTSFIDMRGGTLAHVLNLNGANNAVDNLLNAASLALVDYNRAGDQTIMTNAGVQYRNITLSGSGTKTANGDFNIGNDFTANADFNQTVGTATFNTSLFNQNLLGSATNVNFFNLTFFNGFSLGRTKTIARNIVVNSNLTISGGATSASVLMGTNNIDVNGNITLQDGAGAGIGAILTTTTGNINIAGNWSLGNNSTAFNAGTGIVTFDGTTQAVGGNGVTSFYDVIFNNSGTKTLNQNMAATNAITVDGTANLDVNTRTVNSKDIFLLAGNITATTAAINLSGDWINNATPTSFVEGTSTVSLNGAGIQNIAGTSSSKFFNLATANTNIKNVGQNIEATNVTIGGTSTLDGGNSTITVTGDWTNTSIFAGNAGTVLFTGATLLQNLTGNTTFFNLAVNKSAGSVLANTAPATVITVSNNTAITAGTLDLNTVTGHNLGLNVSGTGTLALSATAGGNTVFPGGDFVDFLSPAGTGTVEYNNSTSYNIAENSSYNYYHVKITGSGTKTITTAGIDIDGDLTVDGGLTLNGGSATMNLNGGDFINNGTFNGATGICQFANTSADQNITGTGTYNFFDLYLAKNNNSVILQKDIRVSSFISFQTDGFLVQGTNNITLGTAAQVATLSAFGATCMIKQDGTNGAGDIIKEGTTAAHFVGKLIPIGTGTMYAPMIFTALTATITGTATISIKTIPYVTPFPDYLARYWRLNTTNISSITDAKMDFTYDASEIVGVPDVVIRRQGGVPALPSGSFYGASTFGVNGIGNTFLTEEWTLGKADQLPATYYSLQSGDWSDPNTWTQDPSGAIVIDPPSVGGPNFGDRVIILGGRTVTMDENTKNIAGLTIFDGATLEVGATTGHSFGTIDGSGLMRLQNITLPNGVYTAFVSSVGGTIEFYDVAGNLSTTQTTYNNLILSGAVARVLSSPGALTYTINGNLALNGGSLTLGDAANNIALNIAGNWSVAASASVSVVNANVQHNIAIGGDFTNDGVVRFTNLAPVANANPYLTPVALSYYTTTPTNGFAKLTFNTTKNAIVACNNTTDFYAISLDKGIDPTYSLRIDAADTAYFALYGRNDQATDANATLPNEFINKALAIQSGTLILGNRVKVPSLTQDGNYRINQRAVMLIDGARVNTHIGTGPQGGRAPVVYGKLRIDNGYYSASGSAGIVLRGQGGLEINGGLAIASQFRPSVVDPSTPRGSFKMTGGNLTLHTLNPQGGNAETSNNGACFVMAFRTSVFEMSGGTINIFNPVNNGGVTDGGWFVNCDDYNVTGGTVNMYIPNSNNANQDFGINSSAPLYNVNIYKIAGAQPRIAQLNAQFCNDLTPSQTVAARKFTVLNDLYFGPNVVFDAAGQDLIVGGNFTLDPTATYTTGANTTILGGSGSNTQVVTFNKATPDILNNLTIDNSLVNATVTFAGNNFTVNGNLNIAHGQLADGGQTITVRGNLSNSGTHTGAGKIVMSGTNNITVGGSGSSYFTNLELNKASGTATFTANQKVLGTLSLTNNILDLASFNLTLDTNAVIAVASPSATRMIRTSGNTSDGGLTKIYKNSTGTFLFPIGTGTSYAPASVGLTATTYGSLTVRSTPVAHPIVTAPFAPNDTLSRFWRVNSSGFAGVSAVNMRYDYAVTDIPGGDGNDNTYVAAIYDQNLAQWTTQNTVTPASNFFTYNTASTIDGAYTAGNSAAFGSVVVYRSIVPTGNWETVGSWKRVQNGIDIENPSTTLPGANNPVVISNNTNITVNGSLGALTCGSLNIEGLGVLDLGTTISTQNHNFGFTNELVTGNGKLRISSSGATARFPAGDFGNFLSDIGGTVEYYRTSTDFVLPTTSIAPNNIPLTTYNNLILTPDGGTITMPAGQNTTVFTDMSVGATSAGTAFLSNAVSAGLTINRDLTISGLATFRYQNGNPRTVVVGRDVTVGNGATFDVATTGTAVTNALRIARNLLNNGTFDMSVAGNRVTDVTFNTATDATITGTGATTDFNRMIVNKGSSQATILEVNASNFTVSGANNTATKALALQNGTLKLTSNQTTNISSGGGDYDIPATAGLWVNGATATVTGVAAGATTGAGVSLGGLLKISSGAVSIAHTTGTNNNYIEYASVGSPTIEIEGGTLTVASQIRPNGDNNNGGLIYKQSAGTVTLATQAAPETRTGVLAVFNSGSVFEMSGGTLTLARGRVNSGLTLAFADLYLQASSHNVTGGTINLSSNLAGANDTLFTINATTPLFNLNIDTVKTGAIKPRVYLLVNGLTVKNNLSMFTATFLKANNLNLNIGGNFRCNGSYQTGTRAVPLGTNLTTFDGALSNQVWHGTGINNVYNLAINNTFASGVVQLAGLDVLVRNNLTLTNGTFNGNTRVITVKNNIDNSAIHTSSGSGRILLNGTVLQTLSGSGAGQYGSVEIDNALSIKAAANATINGTLTFTNGIYDLQQYGLTFGLNAAIGGTPNSTKMLRTSGVILDAGVSKICGTGAFSFTFPFGVGGKYTPIAFNATTNTTIGGTITAKPVNSQHPATSTTALLKYYWQVSNTGFTGGTLNITHDYFFDQIDANGRGVESNYIAARFKSDLTWALAAPLVGSVDITNNIVNVNGSGTGVNYINGDYTAGEPFAFTALPTYISNGTGGGNWEDPNTWQNLEVPLPGSAVLVIASDVVTVTTNSRTVLQVTIEPNATIELGTTKFHNFGTMLGTGTLSSNSASLPGGNYTAYVAAGGGTIRFNGTGYTLPGFPFVLYNNLVVNSSGTINMATVPYTTNGNFTLSAGTFNQGTRGITIRGSFTNAGNYVQSTGNLIVSGNFTNNATFNGCLSCGLSTGTITLAGNFANNGTFVSPSGFFTFNGTTNQTLGGTIIPTISRLSVNKSAGKVILTNNLNIQLRLTLTQRNLVLGNFNLRLLQTNSLILESSVNSYIEANGSGTLARIYGAALNGAAVLYPVGDASNYTPLTLTMNSATYAGGANIAVNLTPAAHPQIGAAPAYLNRYWTVSPTGITSPNYTISYTYANPVEITGDDTSPLFSAGKYSGSWLQGGTYTRAARTFNWSALTSFSDFTGCEACGSVVLPVTLVNFRAVADNGHSNLTWATASETGSSHFDIERSSDGKTFQKIGSVASVGNSNVLQNYQFVDAKPFAVSYYRLKQVDVNGDYDYSSMVKVSFEKNKTSVFNIFPNPANATQEISADLSSWAGEEVELTVNDVLGRQWIQQVVEAGQSKPTVLFDANQLPAGVYVVSILTSTGVRQQQRLVIQK